MLPIFNRPLTLAAASLLLVSACAVGLVEEPSATSVVEVSDTAKPSNPGAPQDTGPQLHGDPVYFGASNYLDRAEETSAATEQASYSFQLLADSNVAISLSRHAADGPATVGFTVFRVESDKRLDLGTAQGSEGAAKMTLFTKYGGTYIIELFEGLDPDTLVLDLTCLAGSCAPKRQPGETCANKGALQCDDGLVCRFEDGTCKAPKKPGRCEIPPKDCKSEYAPVCGCDGKTWGNDCFARQAGVSILREGTCENSK